MKLILCTSCWDVFKLVDEVLYECTKVIQNHRRVLEVGLRSCVSRRL